MKKFTISQIPFSSFFSKDLYVDAALNWQGTGFGYLLLLLAVCLMPVMVEIHLGIADFVDNEAPKFINQIPDITIADGEVSIEEEQPYYIQIPESDKTVFIIDTTGTVTSLDDTDAMALVTKNKIMIKNSPKETRVFDLGEIDDFTLPQATITEWLNYGKKFLALLLYPWVVLGTYAGKIIQILIYALIGLGFAAIFKTTLRYSSLIRLAVVAVTPCIITKTILNLISLGLVKVELPGILYFLAACGYMLFAVKAISRLTPLEGEPQA